MQTVPDPSHPDYPTRAEISLDAIAHNHDILREMAGHAGIMAVVKADAYGHGAERVAPFLESRGVNRFAVATLGEARALREAGVAGRILVFAPPAQHELEHFQSLDLDANATSIVVAELLAAERFGGRVHLKVDTGMSRVGISPDEIGRALDILGRAASIEAIWTHLATADDDASEFVAVQLDRFRDAVAPYRSAAQLTHVANSGALLNHRHLLDLDETTLVRPGITLYGLSPSPEVDQASRAGLQPAMRVVSRVSHVHTVRAGTSVSYSRRWTAAHDTTIATIQAGYADGVPRALTNRGAITVGGTSVPIVGTVCMDACMVDVGSRSSVRIGDEAVLFGPEGPSCFDVAVAAGTITYEITCRVTRRVRRMYTSRKGHS